jgi:hypothetical protein
LGGGHQEEGKVWIHSNGVRVHAYCMSMAIAMEIVEHIPTGQEEKKERKI